MGLEGIVSKRVDAPYRSGPSKTCLKSKNPASAAVRQKREEEWPNLGEPDLHGSAQMEKPTKAITATLRTMIAIAANSTMERRLAMRQFLRRSRGSLLDHAALGAGAICRAAIPVTGVAPPVGRND